MYTCIKICYSLISLFTSARLFNLSPSISPPLSLSPSPLLSLSLIHKDIHRNTHVATSYCTCNRGLHTLSWETAASTKKAQQVDQRERDREGERVD